MFVGLELNRCPVVEDFGNVLHRDMCRCARVDGKHLQFKTVVQLFAKAHRLVIRKAERHALDDPPQGRHYDIHHARRLEAHPVGRRKICGVWHHF